jgi:hypothetical protein
MQRALPRIAFAVAGWPQSPLPRPTPAAAATDCVTRLTPRPR